MPEPAEPGTPESVAADAVADEPRSTDAGESQPKGPSIWNRLFGGSKTEATAGDSKADGDAATDQQTPSTLTLTQAELDRRVQAETDRREAKRQRDSLEKADQDRRAAVARKLDPAAPEFDPYAGAEEQAQIKAAEESAQQFTDLLQGVGKQHDSATLDVIVEALPEAERTRIFKLEGAGVGLDGRKLIVSEGLKALEKHWKQQGAQEAEAKLKGDPIFRKKVFTEHRGDVEEPELVPGGTTRNGSDFMDMIQSDYQALKGHKR